MGGYGSGRKSMIYHKITMKDVAYAADVSLDVVRSYAEELRKAMPELKNYRHTKERFISDL